MKSESINVQCQQCGTIFQVDERDNYLERVYINTTCPCCSHEENMLNIGKDILDKYLYYNVVMDERYYRY